MKKMNLKRLVILSSLLSVFISCEKVDDLEDVRSVKPVVTIDKTDVTALEGEEITFKLTIDKPLSQDIDLKIELAGGTGSFIDFVSSGEETTIGGSGYGKGEIGYALVFPAFATTAEFTITPLFDLLPEGTETLKIWLRSSGNGLALVDEGSKYINITVNNKTSNDFVAVVDWSQSTYDTFGSYVPGEYLDASNVGHEFCDFDFDLEIYDASFNVVADSYSNCPEMASIPDTSVDGSYYIIPSLWTRTGPTAPKFPNNYFKVKVTMAKPGVWIKEVDVDNVWNYTLGGVQQGYIDGYYPVAELVKTGTTYVLKDYTTGEVLASGRMADFKLKTKKNKR